MRIVSLNIGQPRTCVWKGKKVRTSIFKEPVLDEQIVGYNGLEKDTQSDKRYHGGWDKALYSYDLSFYDYWQKELNQSDLPFGSFGENLSTEGLPDQEVYAGDIFEVGTCLIQAIQPRFPCSRLNLRFNDHNMVKKFAKSLRHGIYYKVLREGIISAGAIITKVESSEIAITIADIVTCYYNKDNMQPMIVAIRKCDLFPDSLKKDLE